MLFSFAPKSNTFCLHLNCLLNLFNGIMALVIPFEIVKQIKKLSQKEFCSQNLAVMACVGYFIWLDRNNLIFNERKAADVYSILAQAYNSVLRGKTPLQKEVLDRPCFPVYMKDFDLFIVDGAFTANKDSHIAADRKSVV